MGGPKYPPNLLLASCQCSRCPCQKPRPRHKLLLLSPLLHLPLLLLPELLLQLVLLQLSKLCRS